MPPHDRRLLFVGVEQELAPGIRKKNSSKLIVNKEGRSTWNDSWRLEFGKSVNMEGRSTPKSNFDEEETGQVD